MYVYVLQTVAVPHHYYVGQTSSPATRLAEHNAGKSPHTSHFRPWRMIVATWFANDEKAWAFERYLKTGSGRAFCRRHF